ncbi:MAG TPA: hydroxymethylpyrimidine/phosphomethylpyrimidine kinase [bacterium]|nr:hydroxymethylpyrimidine/phosphomethylpyrimidine kinase [bacterium]HXC65089.1 hydroxymethylpyrimidine/phosphomethylpyrimidine kinase [bacterium]
MTHPAVVLALGGLDPLGQAGLAADLRAGAALGVLVAPVAAALTVQDSGGARRVQGVDPSLLTEQLLAALRSLPVGAFKVGLLGGAPQAQTLAAVLESVPGLPVVLDPVLSATPGGSLAAADFLPVLRQTLLAKVTVLTPNLPEAEALLGAPLGPGTEGMVEAAQALRKLGPKAVLLKGGHLQGPYSSDYLCDEYGGMWLEAPRQPTPNTRGTGCTLATLLAALLAQGQPLRAAAIGAKEALGHLLRKGGATHWPSGSGPVGV